MRRLFAPFAVVILLAAACGDDGGSDADTTTTAEIPIEEPNPSSTEAPATEPPPTEPPTTQPSTTDPPVTAEIPIEEPQPVTVPVTMTEWNIDSPTELDAGIYVFEITNVGQFPHQFGILRGTSYDDLPKLDNGAIDEEALGTDVLGKTDNFDSGTGGSIEFALEPGNYVFFCNINLGPNSHAANGQTLNVTVT